MITYVIIAFTCAVSIWTFNRPIVFERLLLAPYEIKRNPNERFRFISHGFIHVGFGHLLFNMATLFFFGPTIEDQLMSSLEYILFYLGAIALSCSIAYQTHQDDPSYKACGASGAISALLFVLVFYDPWAVLYFNFFIPIYYILFAIGYIGYSWYMSQRSPSRIAHDTHLYGALIGISYTLLVHPDALSIFLQKIKNTPF